VDGLVKIRKVNNSVFGIDLCRSDVIGMDYLVLTDRVNLLQSV